MLIASGISLACPGAARAFDSKGHDVIEALAYRTLVEGHGDVPASPDVLRDLINDGAIAPPLCFGHADRPECRSAAIENPLLNWPEPLTDRPDAAFRRQFSDPGQCYHFMATLDDEASPPLEGGAVPRALATTAVERCRDLLDQLLRQVVLVGGRRSRESGHGLYELLHSVGDSFSYAHAQRTATRQIAFLRAWEPAAKLAGGRIGALYSMSPTRHATHDPRDQAYVRNFVEVDGRPCRDLTDYPYEVPFACLSDEGDLARQALVELLVIVRDLRRAQLAAGVKVDTLPERSPAWLAYKEKWFSPVTPCRGAECEARQPFERTPSNDVLLGLSAVWNPTARYYEATVSGARLLSSWDLNPFVYGVAAGLGYRRYDDATQYGVADLEVDLYLPVGKKAMIGLTPAQSGFAFGDPAHSGPQVLSQALRIGMNPFRNFWLGLAGPVQIDWITARLEMSFGVTAAFAPSLRETASGELVASPSGRAERQDATWAPPPLWYGHLKGREATWYIAGSTTPTEAPSSPIAGRFYGAHSIGAGVSWDRNAWGERYPAGYGAFFAAGLRNTAADFRYLTGVVGVDLRWYPVKILGLSLVPVRVEVGPRLSGTGVDSSADVRSMGGRSLYLQLGSRLGLAFRAGLVDLLVQAPTLSWRAGPLDAGELLTFQIGIQL